VSDFERSQVNLLDALMDDQFFTKIVEKFSRPGEKCMMCVDINATIIFGDLISGKDEAYVLTSTMFEGITTTPKVLWILGLIILLRALVDSW